MARDRRYPAHKNMMSAGLKWTAPLTSYTPHELTLHFIEYFSIADALQTQTFPNGMGFLENYVAHVLRRWTLLGYHAPLNGNQHVDHGDPYMLTEAGRKMATSRES